MEFVIDEFGKLVNVKKVKRKDSIVSIPHGVKVIGESVFFGQRKIKQIIIPSSVEVIEDYAFQNSGISKIDIPSSVKVIKRGVFTDCINLENIVIPETIQFLGSNCFDGCEKLKAVDILGNIDNIGHSTFINCSSLQYINLPKSVQKIHPWAFPYCKLQKVILGNKENLIDLVLYMCVEKLDNYYFNLETEQVLICREEIDDDAFEKIDFMEMKEYTKNGKALSAYACLVYDINLIKKYPSLNKIGASIINDSFAQRNHHDICKHLHNVKEYDDMYRRLRKEGVIRDSTTKIECYDLFRLAYSLGSFCDEKIQRQRVCEFLSNAFDKKYFTMSNIHSSFESLKANVSYNKEWADFLMNKENFKTLLLMEKEQYGYMARIYSSFNNIKEYGRSNRGNQKYRKVTIDMCREYFSKVFFEGVDGKTIDISDTISFYTHKQESFDEAVKIRDEYLALRDKGLIDDYILEGIRETLSNLNEISNDKFSGEFLSKYDARNFILGKYCSCCSHLDGVGKSIMRASILHPDCQNLVIKNSEGKIIAKSTLYINRKQGYGVFNNVEINENIQQKEVKEMIYSKYIEVINIFVEKYNITNPYNPITQVNVGMHLNDLKEFIAKNHVKSDVILHGADFSSYGQYEGDWRKEQYIVFKK